MKGKFITFEGCEGVGKSRQLKLLQEYMDKNGIKYYLTREPGGSAVSEKIRNIILDGKNTEMTDECEAMLYAASRVQLLKEIIKPKLDAGELIFCDRFVDSSLAYQGYARGIGIDKVYEMNTYATDGLLPDLTLLVCVKPEVGLDRIKSNNRGALDRLEVEKMEFHKKVYDGYLKVQEMFPERIKIINGENTREKVREDALKVVLDFLKEKGYNEK